jgi:hypothetical protein
MTYAEVRREGRRSVGKAYVRRWIRAEGANPVANQQGYGDAGQVEIPKRSGRTLLVPMISDLKRTRSKSIVMERRERERDIMHHPTVPLKSCWVDHSLIAYICRGPQSSISFIILT